eukprot:3878259-Pyramimonas_sp.AAC.1
MKRLLHGNGLLCKSRAQPCTVLAQPLLPGEEGTVQEELAARRGSLCQQRLGHPATILPPRAS